MVTLVEVFTADPSHARSVCGDKARHRGTTVRRGLVGVRTGFDGRGPLHGSE